MRVIAEVLLAAAAPLVAALPVARLPARVVPPSPGLLALSVVALLALLAVLHLVAPPGLVAALVLAALDVPTLLALLVGVDTLVSCLLLVAAPRRPVLAALARSVLAALASAPRVVVDSEAPVAGLLGVTVLSLCCSPVVGLPRTVSVHDSVRRWRRRLHGDAIACPSDGHPSAT